jgi:hypothetical protein
MVCNTCIYVEEEKEKLPNRFDGFPKNFLLDLLPCGLTKVPCLMPDHDA